MELTSEQLEIVEDQNRLRVVEACPGSGKTRLFVAQFEKYLQSWTDKRSGIAAISFTNVAQREIAKRVTGRLGPPHFVGTIDSFVLHFIVRPFANLMGAAQSGIRLMPSPFCEELELPTFRYGQKAYENISIFCMQFCGGTEDSPVLSFDANYKRVLVTGSGAKQALSLKKGEWKKTGRISHSDSHFIASDILHSATGTAIARVLARRFPVILVDEVQDTGWFLGRALLKLLECELVRSLVVGDSDQGIYQFGGADTGLFEKLTALPGAKLMPLTRTQRCSVQVTKVIRCLSLKNLQIEPKKGADTGRAILIIHGCAEPELSASLRQKILKSRSDLQSAFFITRKNETAKSLNGKLVNASFPGQSAIARAVDRAGALMRSGESAMAVRLIGKQLGAAVLGNETPTRRNVEKHGINYQDWKASLHKVLMVAAKAVPGESWQLWVERLKDTFIEEVKLLGKADAETVFKNKFRGGPNAAAVRELTLSPAPPKMVASEIAFQTIHQVKGAESEFVMHFVPRPAKESSCPSVSWWDQNNQEERRVAFVAASRASNTYVLAVHKDTFGRLGEKRKAFVELFEVIHET